MRNLLRINQLLAITLIAGLGLLSGGCTTYQDVDFLGVTDYEIIDYDTEGIEAEFTMKIKNPNPYNIKIKDSDIDLYINGDRLGKAKLTNNIKLKKKTTKEYKVRLKSKFDKVGSSVLTLGKSLFGGSVKVRAKGWVKASAFMISQKVKFDVSENVKPEGSGIFGK